MKRLFYFFIAIMLFSTLPEIAQAQSDNTSEQRNLQARDNTTKREKKINRKNEIRETSNTTATTAPVQAVSEQQSVDEEALDQTIIRWDIQSKPQGADIYWRVLSKTPDVKSTNNKYLMTTPYESTQALDIKGLTKQTASNVRIVIRCEKDGYLPQEKEFNVRMVMDQEEISAFFKLVKEED